jgi:protocatechuate 4,5-dioxygenase, beta chain
VIGGVATDHLTQWFDDNMPAFLVGRCELIPATFPNEEREFGIPVDTLGGDATLAHDILIGGLERGFDFSSSREFRADHSIYLPYAFLCPDKDIPIVPVFTNAIAPPMPPAQRFLALGRVLRAAVEASPLDRRVVIVASGHLATEVGGPKQFQGAPDPGFDELAVHWVSSGDVESLLAELTPARMLAAGNVTAQFLNFLVTIGAANGKPAAYAAGVRSRFASNASSVTLKSVTRTGGTAAGLALGMELAGLPARIVGVRVVSRLVANKGRVVRLARRAARLIERLARGARVPELSCDRLEVAEGYFGGAYGRETADGVAAAERFRDRHGPASLEPSYTAKAFAATLAACDGAPTLFWLSFDSRWLSEPGTGNPDPA